MSVNATGHVSEIWSRATSALSNTPSPQSVGPARSEIQPDNRLPPPTRTDGATANPFQQLSSNLQSVLIQMQSQKASGQ